MAENIVRLTLPSKGMNTDTSASQIDDDESPELYNVIVSEPGQVRPRKGWKRRTTPVVPTRFNRPPVGLISNGNNFILSVRHTDQYISPFHLNGSKAVVPTGFSVGCGPFGTGTNDTSGVMAIASGTQQWSYSTVNVCTRVPSVSFESSAFYVQEPAHNPADAKAGYETRLYAWSGLPELTMQLSARINTTTGTSDYLIKGYFDQVPRVGTTDVSLTGHYIRWPGILANERRSFTYRIREHIAGSQEFLLDKQYGLGSDTWEYTNQAQTPVGMAACTVSARALMVNAPERPGVVAVHLDRMFVGRGVVRTNEFPTVRGEYQNAIFWSEVGAPDYWRDEGYLLLDDNFDDAITAFGHAAGQLLVFRRRSFYVLEGDGTNGFGARMVSAQIGCVDPYSVCQWQDWCIFVSEEGVFAFDGSQLVDLSQPEPGHGIRSEMLPLLKKDGNVGNAYMHRQVACTVINDYLLVSIQDTRSTSTPQDMFMCHLPSRAWTKWGNASWPTAFYLFRRVTGQYMRETHGFGLTQELPQTYFGAVMKPKHALVASLDNVVSSEEPMEPTDRFDEMPQYLSDIPNGSPNLPLTEALREYLP